MSTQQRANSTLTLLELAKKYTKTGDAEGGYRLVCQPDIRQDKLHAYEAWLELHSALLPLLIHHQGIDASHQEAAIITLGYYEFVAGRLVVRGLSQADVADAMTKLGTVNVRKLVASIGYAPTSYEDDTEFVVGLALALCLWPIAKISNLDTYVPLRNAYAHLSANEHHATFALSLLLYTKGLTNEGVKGFLHGYSLHVFMKGQTSCTND